MIKDGWHDVSDFDSVYTEAGMVLRAIRDGHPATVYRWDSRRGHWTNVCPLNYETFRHGYRTVNYIIW